MIMYEAVVCISEIRKHEVTKLNDKTVWIKGVNGGKDRRTSLASDYSQFFHSFDAARAFLVKRATDVYNNAKEKLNAVRGLTEADVKEGRGW